MPPHGENRGVRYCARRAADPDCRSRPLDDGVRRLAHYRSLLAGSLPGIFVGSYFAIRVPERALKLVLRRRCSWWRAASRTTMPIGRVDLYRPVSMSEARWISNYLVVRKTATLATQKSIVPPVSQRRRAIRSFVTPWLPNSTLIKPSISGERKNMRQEKTGRAVELRPA